MHNGVYPSCCMKHFKVKHHPDKTLQIQLLSFAKNWPTCTNAHKTQLPKGPSTQIVGFQGPKPFRVWILGPKTLLFGYSDPRTLWVLVSQTPHPKKTKPAASRLQAYH